jgi:hypothetical protein
MISGSTKLATAQRSMVETSRPPVRNVSISAENGIAQRSENTIAAVCPAPASIWASSGLARKPNPVAVMRRPLRLSGRRRQAMSPHAANEPPTSRKTTCAPSTGCPPLQITGTSAPNSAARTRAASASQKAVPRSDGAKRVST